MKFRAEMREVKSTKRASIDMEYRIVLVTDDQKVLALGALPGDTMFEVAIEPV